MRFYVFCFSVVAVVGLGGYLIAADLTIQPTAQCVTVEPLGDKTFRFSFVACPRSEAK